jgi:UDP-N-acetylglucosamine 2-epimerase (non-hydrolysing)
MVEVFAHLSGCFGGHKKKCPLYDFSKLETGGAGRAQLYRAHQNWNITSAAMSAGLSMLKVLSVLGTRPEAIKMAPVVTELRKYSDRIAARVCVTAQHREMLDQVLQLFDITPEYDLGIMHTNQGLTELTARLLLALEPVLLREKPDWVLVQGDTTTVVAASLAAYYQQIKIGHVEAGLRTGHKYQPFPEEVNRKITDAVADLYFAPTENNRRNLLAEGVSDKLIRLTGNTVIDALLDIAKRPYDWSRGPLATIPSNRRLILVTAHRRESFGLPFQQLCLALREIASAYRQNVHIVYPVHLNPNVQQPVRQILGGLPNVSLLPPMDYLPFVHLMKASRLILTDSGGIQEEAPGFGVPVLVMREKTERPEALAAGTSRLVGTKTETIVEETRRLLDEPEAYRKMAQAANPYGDGHAAERIVEAILEFDN